MKLSLQDGSIDGYLNSRSSAKQSRAFLPTVIEKLNERYSKKVACQPYLDELTMRLKEFEEGSNYVGRSGRSDYEGYAAAKEFKEYMRERLEKLPSAVKQL